jgi:integrase
MTAEHSTPKSPRSKPSKPYPEYPLTAHPAGYWCKKIRGKIHYFGPWDDPDGALTKYLEQKDALHAGRKPKEDTEGTTIKELCNRFLNVKQALVDTGELSPRTWTGYKQATDEIVSAFGKGRLVADLDPDDFASLRNRMARKWGPHRLGTTIQCVRCVFKFAYDAALISAPMRFGPGFKRPSKKTLRLHRAKKGLQMFEAEELRKILAAAGTPLKAMILLGVNCGFGNHDVASLPLSALDLEGGWADYHRPKTGVHRRCPLWSETVAAIKEALAKRPEPKEDEHKGLVFVTKYKGPWHKSDSSDTPISNETRKVLDKLGINGKRNFYALRHTFETIGGEAKDQIAVDFIMGHAREDMASVYRERISDERLSAVTDHVHAWLFKEEADK